MQLRLSHHLIEVSGARGPVILGSHGLVVRASTQPLPCVACYGIDCESLPPFHPMFAHSSRRERAGIQPGIALVSAILAVFDLLSDRLTAVEGLHLALSGQTPQESVVLGPYLDAPALYPAPAASFRCRGDYLTTQFATLRIGLVATNGQSSKPLSAKLWILPQSF